jgi:hypothetical protein
MERSAEDVVRGSCSGSRGAATLGGGGPPSEGVGLVCEEPIKGSADGKTTTWILAEFVLVEVCE